MINHWMKCFGSLGIILLLAQLSEAEVRVARIFGDNMVLQQKCKNAVWGWAEPGEKVTVTASWGAKSSAKAGGDGRWRVFLETPGQGTGYQVTVVAKSTLTIKNVAVGEVWLCAGQSNMGWSTANTFSADSETNVDLPNLRIFKSQREHWHQPLEQSRDRLQQWKICNAQTAAETSAVAYHFAKVLHQRLGIPVGIIVQAYAGTPIEGWMPWEIQQQDLRTIEYKNSLDSNAQRRMDQRGETGEKALAQFRIDLELYNEKIDAGQTMKNPFRLLQPPFITKPATMGHQYPAHIYNAMIHPVRPYGIRGMIWYQGERNSKNAPQADHYRSQLTRLIGYYRTSWHRLSNGNVPADFPVQFTQLPSWHAGQTDPVEGLEAPWAVNRESMRLVDRDIPKTGMVVSIDTGDAVQLHPKNKKPLGIRHALLALGGTYNKEIVGNGPRYRSHQLREGEMVLDFDSIGSGLMPARPGLMDSFAIAGKDRKWHWGKARIQGTKVFVSSQAVAKPLAVRYAWAMNPAQRNLLYNKEGLPASPFRTDRWPLYEPGAAIVTVSKPVKPDGYQASDWKRPRMTQTQPEQGNDSPSNGLAPEVTDLNADDISFQLEKKIPYLKRAFIDSQPNDLGDGLLVGKLGPDGGKKEMVLRFAEKLGQPSDDPRAGKTDSLLISYRGKLILESYYRRGRLNYPHYQMSITKSYTALGVGRAIQLGYLKMNDLHQPVISFLKDIDSKLLASGADQITLHQAMQMTSGIRVERETVNKLRRNQASLLGQKQIQAYLQFSDPVPPAPRDFKYQACDPALAMQILDAAVPGTAREFIRKELFGPLAVESYYWQDDVSGLPKSAAGCSIRSRDMVKMGQLVLNHGQWKEKQIVPAAYVDRATSPIKQAYGSSAYGYFWWVQEVTIEGKVYRCKQGRGAGGQFLFIIPQLDLVIVATAHNAGMGNMLREIAEDLIPAFVGRSPALKGLP